MGYFDDAFNLLWNDDTFLLCEKKQRTRDHVIYMLDRTQQLFTWQGLPKTIKPHVLESYLQTCGNVCVTEVTETNHDNKSAGLYIFFGGLGGELDENYEPTIYTIANPYLRFNKELKIGSDCIRMRNDRASIGLIPMFTKYASMLNENEISMNMLSIIYRIDNLTSADDDRTAESARQYFKDIVSGKFGVISSSEFFDGIRNDKTGASNKNIKDLIEYEQYLHAKWFNEIGLNSNYNMKRERIVASEAQLNDDALIPLVENMLSWRKKGIEELKELYGDKYNLDTLDVTLNPIWDLDNIYTSIPEAGKAEETENIENGESDISNSIVDNPDNSGDIDISGNEIGETETSERSEESEESANVEININIENAETVETVETEENEETEEEEKNENDISEEQTEDN